MPKRILLWLATVLALVAPVLAESSQTVPSSPFTLGGIVAWIVCATKKRDQIGGWLMYFYWVTYSGAIVSAILLFSNSEGYVPQNFLPRQKFPLLMLVDVPHVAMVFVLCAVATFLLLVRERGMLNLLRGVLAISVVSGGAALVVDSRLAGDTNPLNVMAFVAHCIWLTYFFVSKRVRHVFVSHDWETAVDTIYPESVKIKIAP